jgi:16S rRNA (cytosine967-C5)-methyltransferase
MNRPDSPPRSGPRPVVVDAARDAAAAALARVLDDDAWAAPALSSVLDAAGLQNERDRAFATELFYGALRFARPLEASILRGADKPGRGLDPRIKSIMLVAAYQLQHLRERVPAHAAVDAAVTAVKRARPGLDGFANALLRKLGSPLHELLKPGAPLPEIAEAWGVPLALAEAITAGLPAAEHVRAVGALCDRPTTWAASFVDLPAPPAPAKPRVDTSASTEVGESDQVDTSASHEVKPVALVRHPFAPQLVAAPAGKVTLLPGFAEGAFMVADPGSFCCAAAVGAKPGVRVLDLCAAPGTKSVLLRKTGATVTAVELNPKRAKKIQENLRRMRVDVDVVVGDATALDVAAVGGAVDAVLLDAPCTGLGTTRRKPEIKLRRTDDDVVQNARLQAKLLAAAARFVKPGGVLVYSVCSPLPQEGAHQIEAFLAGHADFVREPLPAVLKSLPPSAFDELGQVRLRPHLHDADAFFIARLRRA